MLSGGGGRGWGKGMGSEGKVSDSLEREREIVGMEGTYFKECSRP